MHMFFKYMLRCHTYLIATVFRYNPLLNWSRCTWYTSHCASYGKQIIGISFIKSSIFYWEPCLSIVKYFVWCGVFEKNRWFRSRSYFTTDSQSVCLAIEYSWDLRFHVVYIYIYIYVFVCVCVCVCVCVQLKSISDGCKSKWYSPNNNRRKYIVKTRARRNLIITIGY
jgi:hypothetical protein